MRRCVGLAALGVFLFSTPAFATPVQWSVTGVVNGIFPGLGGTFLGPLYPVGTPLSILMSFDTVAPNYATNPATQGFFQFPGAGGQLTIGTNTFTSFLIAFEINCPGASCQGAVAGPSQLFNPLDAVTRVVLVGGPPLSVSIVNGFGGFVTGFCVVCADGLTYTVTSSTITTTPEPASIGLIATGLLAMAARRRRVR